MTSLRGMSMALAAAAILAREDGEPLRAPFSERKPSGKDRSKAKAARKQSRKSRNKP